MLHQKTKQLRPAQGFTIVEVLVVLAIIGALLTVVVMSFSQNAKRMSKNDAVAVAEQVKMKLATYFSEKQRYPASRADVVAYINGLTGSDAAKLATSFNDAAKYDYVGYTAGGLTCSTASTPKCDKYVITVKATGWGGGASDANVVVNP